MSTHARPLAELLAAASDADLEHLLRARGVPADAAWEDFFDAAEALLDPQSVERAVTSLTRAQAHALHAAASGAQAPLPAVEQDFAAGLSRLALLDADGRILAPVATAVAGHPAVPEAEPAEAVAASPAASARAAERAFTTIGAVAELLLAARAAPLGLVATGALNAAERRRFGENRSGENGDADLLRQLTQRGGLLRPIDRRLHMTAAGERWLAAPFAKRWTVLTDAFRRSLPAGIRDGDGWIAPIAWPGAHPWDPRWPEEATRLLTLARLLGLEAPDASEPEWAAVARTGGAVDATALQALLPGEVDRIFLQHDFTAIAPGPLHPALDNRLRAMTVHESAAQASSYRFTAESVAAALVEGETEASILAFLGEVSLTGVPQPLAYLVSRAAVRHGLVRVGPDGEGGTVVRSSDAHLLHAMEVDRSLAPVGLVGRGDRLWTPVEAEAVAWALADARYPATLVDGDDRAMPATRARVVDVAAPEGVAYAPLIARLRAHHGADADAAWLDRELEAAVRSRAVVQVEVAMPDGSRRELTLEAAGLSGGRLRGRDRSADVERTLPVRSIRSVRVRKD